MKKRILLVISAITLISAILMFVSGILAAHFGAESVVGSNLQTETRLVASLLHNVEDLSEITSDDEFRVSVISLDGSVLFDTENSSENHSDREEVQAAFADNPKIVRRYSATTNSTMLYYAVKTTLDDGSEVAVRLAAESGLVNEYLNVSLPVFILVLVTVAALSVIAGKRVSDKFAEQMNEINKSLKSVADGSYVPIKVDSRDSEFFSVVNSINELSADIYRHIVSEETERRKLGAVLDSVSQGIVALNDKRETVFINKSALKFFGDGILAENGTTESETVDQQYGNGAYNIAGADESDGSVNKDLLYFVDNLDFYQQISAHLDKGGVFEYNLSGKDISVCVNSVTDARLKSLIAAIVVIDDISSEKRVAREKSDFFVNASHELKTPVTVIRGLSEILLARGNLDDFCRKKLTTLHNESLRLGSIVGDMMELSALEHAEGSQPQNVEDVDLRSVAEDVRAELAESARAKNISYTVRGSGIVQISAKHAFELTENLCSNAVNYNRENGSVDVTIAETAQGVTLTVADGGIGIEEEHIPRLCERFYRVDKSRSKNTGGTGLGLAIVKHICLVNKAELKIESTLGKGTTVTVFFATDR